MFLGIDIGTTAVKVLILDAAQVIVGVASSDYHAIRTAPGWIEQDPDDWIRATELSLGTLRSQVPQAFSEIEAVGLSGQMHSVVLLGRDRRPLRRAMLWNDARGGEECMVLRAAVPNIGYLTGVLPMAGFSAAKILWVRKHEPEVFNRIAHIILPKDYVRLWLTGELHSDVSDAAGMQLLDGATRDWAPEMLFAVGVDREQLAPISEGTTIAGRLSGATARRLGLSPGIPVSAGGADAGTSALGIGCVDNGQGFISLGTAAVFVVAQDSFRPRPETMLHDFAHCVPGHWYQMAGMLNGASALSWASRLCGEPDLDRFLAEIERQYTKPSQVVFLPYLTGERTPHNNPSARGVFFGLDTATNKHDLIQAVIEGVAFSIRDADECLRSADAFCPSPGFIGGGAQSQLWGRIIATLLKRPILHYCQARHVAAVGAARLAMITSGMPLEEVVVVRPRGLTVDPVLALSECYEEKYILFTRLYRALESYF